MAPGSPVGTDPWNGSFPGRQRVQARLRYVGEPGPNRSLAAAGPGRPCMQGISTVATNDWKAELKRRIEDIKEKKKVETDVQRRVRTYQNSAAAAAAPILEPVVEMESGAEELPPAPAPPVPTTPRRRRAATPPAEPTPMPVAAADERDPLFQVSSEERDEPADADESRREATILAELNRISGGDAESKREPSRRKEASSTSIDSLPTLFAIEETEPNPVKERVIAAARAAAEDLDEEPAPEPRRRHPEPPAPEQPASHLMTIGDDGDAEESAFVLDDDLDRYVPINEEVEPETAPAAAARAVRPVAKELVIDRTQRHTNNLRLGAGALDALVLLAVEGFIVWMSSMLVEANALELLINSPIAWGAFFVVLHFIYYVLFTATTGQTPGKRLMKMRVEAREGGLIGVLPGIARWILLVVSIAAAGLGMLMMYMNRDGRTLHDLILGMQVKRQHL